MKNEIPNARRVGKLNGKNVTRFVVRAIQSGLDSDLWENHEDFVVLAHTPEGALNLIRDELEVQVTHPTELITRGVRGGIKRRHIGWESLIGARMIRPKPTSE